MTQLLFGLILMEMLLIVIFVFRTPLRKLVILGLDRVKRGRGPIVVKTVCATVFVVMTSNIYNLVAIHNRRSQDGEVNTTDQILFAKHLLDASLMAFSLFLALMIDRLHHYMRELRIRRKSMEAAKKLNQGMEAASEVKALEAELTSLQEKLRNMELEINEKTKEANSAEANALALKKQSEGFLLEYDRLLEENQNLRGQLQSSDWRWSHSDSKKSM